MSDISYAAEMEAPNIWNISKDSFVPPPTRRIVRGWDRTPVSAHAPRLQGLKVWKKVTSRTAELNTIYEDSQTELEKEGTGARKKSRMICAKENIGNAAWEEKATEQDESKRVVALNSDYVGLEQINVGDTVSETSNDQKLLLSVQTSPETSVHQFVPRKRTNTNHVITPRKPLRQACLNIQAQKLSTTESFEGMPEKRSRPRKSLRRSFRRSTYGNSSQTPRIKSLVDLVTTNKVQETAEPRQSQPDDYPDEAKKTVDGEKSLRRSTRSRKASAVHISDMTDFQQDVDPKDLVALLPPATEILLQENLSSTTPEYDTCWPTTTDIIISEDAVPVTTDIVSAYSTWHRPVSKPGDILKEIAEGNLGFLADQTPTSQLQPVLIFKDTDVLVNLSQVETDLAASVSATSDITETLHTETLQNDAESLIPVDTHSKEKITANLTAFGPMEESVTNSGSEGATQGPQLGEEEVAIKVERIDSQHSKLLETQQLAAFSDSKTALSRHSADNVEKVSRFNQTIDTQAGTRGLSTATPNYDHDDTDMLRNFLTRVQANKAAKRTSPRRKRSLPHSPLQIPLGGIGNPLSPSPLQLKGDIDLNESRSPSKRKPGKISVRAEEDNKSQGQSCRRSGRTRLLVKAPPVAPSFIPVRRLGQEADTTVTLKRNEEKEIAALTRVNTRKNKGSALSAQEFLAKKADEKDDPSLRQRLLKEIFDENAERAKQGNKEMVKTVSWAEELAQYHAIAAGKLSVKSIVEEKLQPVAGMEEKKLGAVRVGVRSKMALGMGVNGTPARKRRTRERN